MSLLDLWKKTPDQIQAKHVQQLIAFAGEGHLADGNNASAEFRQFLSNVSSELLLRYTDECLQTKFEGSGFALQDVVNEIGVRLGFEVTPGRYRGTFGSIGFDGLWLGSEGNHIIVEVKTTDAYRIDLDTIADYRRNLIKSGEVKEEESSILVIVGRQDTGDLEAQIRGSRHAWDVRLISVDSLIRLLTIREEVEDPSIEARIRAILVPREFTRVDGIIDLAFSATEEILHEEKTPAVSEQDEEDLGGRKFIPVSFHEACVARIIRVLNQPLVKRSRAIFTNADNSVVVLCAVSREHNLASGTAYWFAFHPHQKAKLQSADQSYVAFGCGSPEKLIMIPFTVFGPWVEGMNQTHRDDGRSYWHVQIFDEEGRLILHRKKDEDWPDITEYLLTD